MKTYINPITAKFLEWLPMVFLISIKVSLVVIGVVVWCGAMEELNNPKNAPKAPPTTKLITPLNGQLSITACIRFSSIGCSRAKPLVCGINGRPLGNGLTNEPTKYLDTFSNSSGVNETSLFFVFSIFPVKFRVFWLLTIWQVFFLSFCFEFFDCWQFDEFFLVVYYLNFPLSFKAKFFSSTWKRLKSYLYFQ